MINVLTQIIPKFGRIRSIILLLLTAVLSFSLWGSITKAQLANSQLREAQNKLEKQEKDYQDIQKKIDEVKSEIYVEKQIRDRLGLAKQEEVVIVLPDDEVLRKLAPEDDTEEEALPDPNWKKWLSVFGISL